MNLMHPLPRVLHLVGDAAPLHAAAAQLAAALDLRLDIHADSPALPGELDPDGIGVVLLNTGADLTLLDDPAVRSGGLPVVVLAQDATIELCRRAFNAGAVDFLCLPLDVAALHEVVRATLARLVLQDARRRDTLRARQAFARLSEREKDVLALIAGGLTYKEAARALGVSPRTIEVHRARLSLKLEVGSVAELVRRYAPLLDELETGRPLLAAWRAGMPEPLGCAA